jgi:hypothetical protein
MRVLWDHDADTLTYFHGDGEAVLTCARPELVAWAKGDLSRPHPLRTWCEEVHRYEIEAVRRGAVRPDPPRGARETGGD